MANAGSESVTIIDAVHNVVTAQASVGTQIYRMAASPDGLYLYFASSAVETVGGNIFGATVTKFDLSTRTTVSSTILSPTGTTFSISVSADSSTLYIPISSSSEQAIAVLDTATLTVQRMIHVTNHAGPAAVAGKTAWMLCGDAICRIDLTTATLVASSAANYGGSDFCISPDLTKVYVSPGWGFVYVLDAATLGLEQQITDNYETSPREVFASTDGKYLYIANYGSLIWYDTASYTLQGTLFFPIDGLQAFALSTSGMIYEFESSGNSGNLVGMLDVSNDTITSEFEAVPFDQVLISPGLSDLFGVANSSLYSLQLTPGQAPKHLSPYSVTTISGFSADGTLIYVNTDESGDFLSGIDAVAVATGQVVNQYGYTGNWLYGPSAIISPDTTALYFDTYENIFDYTPNGISVLDTSTFSAEPVPGAMPGFNPVGISSDGTKLFIESITADNDIISSSGLSIFNLTTGQITQSISYPAPVMPFSSSFTLGPKNLALYALTQDGSGNLTLTAFNPNTLGTISTYALGSNSGSFVVSSDETHAFITLNQSRSIVDLNLPNLTLHATIPTGYSPGAIALAPH